MGLRFRKSIKIAPGVKVNLNKNSVSTTVGTRGAHYTVNSKGRKTASVGIPGTGLSYTKTSGGSSSRRKSAAETSKKRTVSSQPDKMPHNSTGSNRSNRPNRKKWYQKTGWIIALLILFFPVGLFLMWKYANWKKPVKGIITALTLILFYIYYTAPPELEKISLSTDTSKVYDINQNISIKTTSVPDNFELPISDYKATGGELSISDNELFFTASKAGEYEIFAEHDEIKSNKITIKVEDKEAIAKAKAEEEAKKKAEEEAKKKAEEEAARKAEEERIAAEKAEQQKAEEQARINAEQQEKSGTNTGILQQQEVGGTVYWVSGGEVYHSTPDCRSLKRSSNIKSGSISESGKSRPCKVCH